MIDYKDILCCDLLFFLKSDIIFFGNLLNIIDANIQLAGLSIIFINILGTNAAVNTFCPLCIKTPYIKSIPLPLTPLYTNTLIGVPINGTNTDNISPVINAFIIPNFPSLATNPTNKPTAILTIAKGILSTPEITPSTGHAREQFDNMFYRKEAKKMLMPYIAQFEGYIKSGYDIKGIIAIDGSPSCGFNKTCSSYKWYGELSGCSNLNEKIDDIALVDGRGIFMEVLINLLDEYGLEIPVYVLNESNLKESSLDILSKL